MQSTAGQAELSPPELPEFSAALNNSGQSTFEALQQAKLVLSIRWGRTYLRPEQINNIGVDGVLPLDQLARDVVDVFVDGQLVGRGEVLVHEGRFAVRITELRIVSEPVGWLSKTVPGSSKAKSDGFGKPSHGHARPLLRQSLVRLNRLDERGESTDAK